MDNSLLVLANEALKGNWQALCEINDLFEENDLNRIDSQLTALTDSEHDGNRLISLIIGKPIYLKDPNYGIKINVFNIKSAAASLCFRY